MSNIFLMPRLQFARASTSFGGKPPLLNGKICCALSAQHAIHRIRTWWFLDVVGGFIQPYSIDLNPESCILGVFVGHALLKFLLP